MSKSNNYGNGETVEGMVSFRECKDDIKPQREVISEP